MTTKIVERIQSQMPCIEEPFTQFTLNKEFETEGFDMEAGQTWIYPTNYSLRDYQFSIIQEALLKNTMVSLPTGLGKTFIAAVVMYNFYRWYPNGKIIFMAPTRPLVKQQIDACYNIMAIPADTTAELTGTKTQASRKDLWNKKRVFFVTPQVLQNDLNMLTELGPKIKCLVFDEAHKAKGNHAYCEVIRKLVPLNSYFRVLALSATPGSTLNDVLEVIHNLLISHLEIRTDESPDVTPYIFERSLETVVVPLGGKLQEVRDAYIQILEKYTRVLVQNKIISGNCSTLTKGKIFMTLKDYKEKNQNGRDAAYPEITRNLNICITLYHAYELLVRHGLRGFLSFFEEHAKKPLLHGNSEIRQLMADIREYLGPIPIIEPLPDGTMLEIPKNSKFGHPKFYKLLDILSDHFKDSSNDTSRVIVFCEYRESVMEAYALLLRHKPLIKPRIFLGQGAISQRQQITVVKSFREGECNTLVATCIGEEGLDVGNVDLIVCFDISNRSPVRMVQRMGRTGRKREGRVVILVTEGKEQQTLKECLIHKQNLTNHILQSSALYQNMYKKNPRMVPMDINPECQKVFITVKPDIKPQKQRNVKIKDMFNKVSANNFNLYENCELEVTENRIPSKQELWCKANPLAVELNEEQMDFSKKIAKLRVLQPTNEIGHSRSSELLVSLLQFAESKKYNIPITQVPVMSSQLYQSSNLTTSTTGLKQTDIRNMFAKIASSSSIDLTPRDRDFDSVEQVDLDSHILSKLSAEIASYLTSDSEESSCKICENLFDCSQIKTTMHFNITSLFEPDILILNSCNVMNFEIFNNFLKSETNKLNIPIVLKENNNDTHFIKPVMPNINIYEQTFLNLNDTVGSKNTPLKHPSNVQNVLKKCGISPNLNDSLFDNMSFTPIEKQNKIHCGKEDILPLSVAQSFVDAEFTQIQNTTDIVKEDLTFFNANSLEDIFNEESSQDLSQATVIYSPTECLDKIKNSDIDLNQNGNTSPILSSYEKAHQLKSRVHKKLFGSFTETSSGVSINESVATNDNVSSLPITKVEKVYRLDISKSSNYNQESAAFMSLKKDEPILNDENCKNLNMNIQKNEISGKNNKNCTVTTGMNDVSSFADLSCFGFDESVKESNDTPSNKLDKDNSLLDFSQDLWFGFLSTAPECNDPIKGESKLTIEKDVLIFENKNKCQSKPNNSSNDLIIAQNNKNALRTDLPDYEEIKESPSCKELHTISKTSGNDKILDFPQDSWFDFLVAAPKENDPIDDKLLTVENDALISENKQSQSNRNDCSNDLIITRNSEDHLEINLAGYEEIKKSPPCKELLTVTKKISNGKMHKTPIKRKNASSTLIDLTTSPVLTKKNCQVSKLTLNSHKSNAQCTKTQKTNFKFTINSQKSITDWLTTSNKTSNNQKTLNSIHQSKSISQSVDLDESFQLTFNTKKTPSKNKLRCLSTSSSGSPIINTKPRNYDSLKNATPKSTVTSKVVISSDSDDDFQKPPNAASWINLKPRNILPSRKPDIIEQKTKTCSQNIQSPKRKRSKRKKWKDCEYLEVEAEQEIDLCVSSDTNEDTDDDKFEESFVDDDTQNIANTTITHAQYLKSVRSPVNRGMFKIPKKQPPNINVYSQLVDEGENTYINDTFCVDTEDDESEIHSQEQTISELEIAELVLTNQRNSKRNRKKLTELPKSKRRRIMQINSDSD